MADVALVRGHPVLPAQVPCLGQDEEGGRADVDGAGEDDEAVVRATVGLNKTPTNGDADQAGKRHDRVRGGVVPAVLLRLAHAPDADGSNGDGSAAGKAEQDGEDDDAGGGVAEGQPDAETRDQGQQHGEEAHVEGADHVGVVPRQGSPDDRARVHDGEQVEGEVLAEALVQGVGRDVSEGDEERELEQEDANGRERERGLLEDADVGVRRRVLRGRKAGAHERNADEPAAEADEGEDAGCPAVADLVKEGGEHERKDDSADSAGRGSHAGGEAAAATEPVTDGGNARREEERGAKAGEDAEGEDEMPKLWYRNVRLYS